MHDDIQNSEDLSSTDTSNDLTAHLLFDNAKSPGESGVYLHEETTEGRRSKYHYPAQEFIRLTYKLHRNGGIRATVANRLTMLSLIVCSWVWFHALFVGIRWENILSCRTHNSMPCHCEPKHTGVDCWWKGWWAPIASNESLAVMLAYSSLCIWVGYMIRSIIELVNMERVQDVTQQYVQQSNKDKLWKEHKWSPDVLNIVKDTVSGLNGQTWSMQHVSAVLTRFEDVYEALIRRHKLPDLCTGSTMTERFVFCQYLIPALFEHDTLRFTSYHQCNETFRRMRQRWHLVGIVLVLLTPLTICALIGWCLIRIARDIYKCHASSQHTSIFLHTVMPPILRCRTRKVCEAPHAFEDRCNLIMQTANKLKQNAPVDSFVILRKALRFKLGVLLGIAIAVITWDERIAMLDVAGHRVLVWVAIVGATMNTLKWNTDQTPLDVDHRDAAKVRKQLLQILGVPPCDSETDIADQCNDVMNQLTYHVFFMLNEAHAILVLLPTLFLWKVPNRIGGLLTAIASVTTQVVPCGEIVQSEDDASEMCEVEPNNTECDSSSMFLNNA